MNLIYPSQFYTLASADITDARLLFKKKRYRNAIFLLQQADEKSGKGLLLETGMILDRKFIDELSKILESRPSGVLASQEFKPFFKTLADLTPASIEKALKSKYGHKWTIHLIHVLKKLAPQISNIPKIQELLSVSEPMFSDLKQIMSDKGLSNGFLDSSNFPEIVQRLDNRFLDSERLANPSIKDVDYLVTTYGEVLDAYPLGKEFPSATRGIQELVDVKLDPGRQRKLKKATMNIMPNITRLLALGSLGLLLSPHYTISRYPDENRDFEYDANHAIITRWKQVTKLIERCNPTPYEDPN
ncbi:MAG: HEPN domain-containing protein [Nitrososphaerota archaeon]|nr:HEPN domain-containing protein [Nitrososphaerota archaeon]